MGPSAFAHKGGLHVSAVSKDPKTYEHIDPKLVDVDSLSFYNLCPYLREGKDQCYSIVDIGHEKTSVFKVL